MRSTIKAPTIKRLSIRDWTKGVVTAMDDGRTPIKGLRGSLNIQLDQDGTIRPRPSLVAYGQTFPGTLLGEMFEFTKQVSGLTNENYMLGMFNVAGTTKPYYSKDGGAWTIANGKTFDNAALAHFCQVDTKVLITNGTDTLSYLDIPTLAVIPFTALSTPAAPTAAQTGLTGTTFTYYYRITANSTVGETARSANVSQQVVTQRELWTPASQYITVSWSAVASATSYNVYMGVTSGSEELIAAGVNGLSFRDDGSSAPDVTRPAPVQDTTAGPKALHAGVINGQVFLVGIKDEPRHIRFGGTGEQILDFSPFGGGGYTELGRGTKELPVWVGPFRAGTGDPRITVLCKGTNGQGKRYTLTPDTITSGETVISFFAVQEENGQAGTSSPDGVILYNDSIYYPSTDGFKTTGTKPQIQNLLSTDTVSETIEKDVKTLNNSAMGMCRGIAYQQKLYWALPVGTTENNQIWTLDLQRDGAWMKPWDIAASWLMLYNDNDGMTHFIVISDNVAYELTDAQASYDGGSPFSTNATSGLIKFSEDGREWGAVIDITFVLLRPQGTINFNVAGRTEDSTALEGVGSDTFTADSSVAGWGEAGWGGAPADIFGWSNFTVVPVSFGDAQRDVVIEVDETLQWLTWELNTNTGNTFYQLSDVVIQYIPVGVIEV